ncbi:hypothetical protein L1987_77969 [Smallanthus sonchifolius]|uniref:Uncharacterized protein n=1 Tax=Smallanthus sonchifolius TaxID=185202 RepID=A0ACB8ZB27_9ASTR|nr:hypothetical protein L1987_77969 [Smallanthus sonchifolius]
MAIKPPKDKNQIAQGSIEFGISLDDDDDDIQAEQEPPSRPMGRDKTKAMRRDKAKVKGKAMSSSDYEAKKLSLVEELAETNRVKKQTIEQFDQKNDKFYELEQRKIMLIPANPAVGQELLAILSLLPYEFVRQPQLHPTEGNALFFQLLIFLERLLSVDL